MFSNLINVVEGLAQPHPQQHNRQGSPETSPADSSSPTNGHKHGQGPGSSSSFDLSNVAQSTGHLAESAFSTFRKTLVPHRPFGVTSPVPSSAGSVDGKKALGQETNGDRELKPVTSMTSRTTLEDRLRASFAIGELSKTPTPAGTPEPSHAPSPRGTPAPAPVRPATPTSVPLPDSRPDTPTLSLAPDSANSIETSSQVAPLSASSAATFSDPLSASSSSGSGPATVPEPEHETAASRPCLSIPDIKRYPEADIPLPVVSPPIPTNLAASQSRSTSSISSSSISDESASMAGRYAALEKRFNSVNSQLAEMSSNQDAILAVLLELTPVGQLSDARGLRDYLQSMNITANASNEELRKLNGRLSTYDGRIEELRDTHRLESRSQIEQIDNLRAQLEESEALVKAAQGTSMQSEEVTRKLQAEVETSKAETKKLKETVKEEEEKRTKAISLLKTVRQKLVKAERERDDALREIVAVKEREKAAQEAVKAERAKLEKDIENVRVEKERDIIGLRSHFDREVANAKERAEKEFVARRGQLELEMASIKASLQKEIATKTSKIQTLENSVRSLSTERDSLFDQLQLRQTELESSQSHLETLQSRTSELQFQLREITDRNALLTEELADAQRELEYKSMKPSQPAAEDSSHVRASLEAKYEVRIVELTTRLSDLEKDRNEIEAAMSRSLQQKAQKAQEADALRKEMELSSKSQGVSEEEMNKLKQTIEGLQQQVKASHEQLKELDVQRDRVNDLESQLQKQASDFAHRLESHESELKESRERESQTRAHNKSLREELRKVQNSAALLERHRNPGVGYWSTKGRHENSANASNASETASTLTSPTPSTADLPRVTSPPPVNNVQDSKAEEEVNLEYLRNVILQFLEHKEMRPNLVRVLSIILHFTPQETRRLIAKV